MTKDGDTREERYPFPMTILISTQDVGAFQGSGDVLLKQLFSELQGPPPHFLYSLPTTPVSPGSLVTLLGKPSQNSRNIPSPTHVTEEITVETQGDLSQVIN